MLVKNLNNSFLMLFLSFVNISFCFSGCSYIRRRERHHTVPYRSTGKTFRFRLSTRVAYKFQKQDQKRKFCNHFQALPQVYSYSKGIWAETSLEITLVKVPVTAHYFKVFAFIFTGILMYL
jgi:hypothetical protein